MAEFIPQEGGGPPSGGQPTEFLSGADKAQVADQAMASAAPAAVPAAPAGVPQGAGMGATQENPLTAQEEGANEQEQQQYEDLFSRIMSMVNDTRTPEGGGQSPADALIKLMSEKGKEAHVAIGTAAGLTMQMMIDLAKRNGVEYSGPVMQEVGMDLVVELTEIAQLSGAIENIPEENSPEFEKLIELSALEAAKHVGEWQLRTGQADRQGHMQEMEDQMQREADSGELDDWGMEELDPEIRDRMAGMMRPKQAGAQNGG